MYSRGKKIAKRTFTNLLALSVVISGVLISGQPTFADTPHPTGLLQLHESISGVPAAPSTYNGGGWLPTSVDLSSQLPPVGDQGSLGSCVAFATGYAAKTYQEGHDREWGVTTSNHIFSPSYIYNQIHVSNTPDGGGTYIGSALSLLETQGCTTLDDMPYNGAVYGYQTQPTSQQTANAANHKIMSWEYLPSGNYNEIKSQLAKKNPVVIAIPVYPDFDSISPSNEVYDNTSGTSRGNHALCVVGYDDSKNAVKIINSWGTGWGLNGYGWISYNLIQDLSLSAYVIDELSAPENLTLTASPQSLTWNPVTNATEYEVSVNGTISSTASTTFNYTALNPNTVYNFKVRATKTGDSIGLSEWSKTITAKNIKIGDINNDNSINVVDASMLVSYLVNKTTFTSQQMVAADLNGDGILDNNDKTIFSDYLLGVVSAFPVGSDYLLVYGDVTGDGKIDSSDETIIYNRTISSSYPLTYKQVLAGDLHMDNDINSLDYLRLHAYVIGAKSELFID